MSDQRKQTAKHHATLAARQARHAANNGAQAVSQAATPIAEGVTNVVEDAADKATRLGIKRLTNATADTGTGFFMLSIALYSTTIAFRKFRDVYKGSGRVMP